jgi:hypothetical protein
LLTDVALFPFANPAEGTVKRLSAADVLAALKESDPEAFIGEQERGRFVIDGKFDLRAVAERLSEMPDKQPASPN